MPSKGDGVGTVTGLSGRFAVEVVSSEGACGGIVLAGVAGVGRRFFRGFFGLADISHLASGPLPLPLKRRDPILIQKRPVLRFDLRPE